MAKPKLIEDDANGFKRFSELFERLGKILKQTNSKSLNGLSQRTNG